MGAKTWTLGFNNNDTERFVMYCSATDERYVFNKTHVLITFLNQKQIEPTNISISAFDLITPDLASDIEDFREQFREEFSELF